MCLGLAETNLDESVRVSGIQLSVEECFEVTKRMVGLDQ